MDPGSSLKDFEDYIPAVLTSLALIGILSLGIHQVQAVDPLENVPDLIRSLRLVQIADTDATLRLAETIARRNRLPTLSATNEEERLEQGFSFVGSNFIQDVANNDTEVLLLNNPSGSARGIKGITIKANATAEMKMELFADVTVDSAGPSITIFNANLGSDTNSVGTLAKGGSYSGRTSDPLFATFVPGSGSPGVRFGGSEQAASILVPSNHNLLIEVTNVSGGAEDVGVTLKWIEGDFSQ